MATKKKKITKQELEKIKEILSKRKDILSQMGELEIVKRNMIKSLDEVDLQANEEQKNLEKKYGSVTIDLTDGSISPQAV